MTAQYIEEADQLSNRIAIDDAGTIIAEDTAQALRLPNDEPRSPVE